MLKKAEMGSDAVTRHEPEPAIAQEHLLSVDDIVRIVKRYGGLSQRMYNECICALVPCAVCKVDVDQYWMGQYGREHPGSLHADRRVLAERWRKTKGNKETWEQLKADVFRHLVKMRKEGQI